MTNNEKMTVHSAILLLLTPSLVHCHGNIMIPTSWFNPGGKIPLSTKKHCDSSIFAPCLWFTNNTLIPGEPTLDPSLWTYTKMGDIGDVKLDDVIDYFELIDKAGIISENTDKKKRIENYDEYNEQLEDYLDVSNADFSRNPWRAPGTAPIYSPCGLLGGNPAGCPADAPYGEGADCPGGGYGYGPAAEVFPFKDIVTTKWKAGAVVDVGFGFIANHGGGYSYRLCKLPDGGRAFVTEECFQETPLDFVGDMQWVQYGEDTSNRTEFRANRTRVGTFPTGSQWTRHPIPACADAFGGFFDEDGDCKMGTQFPPPAPGLKGYGDHLTSTGVPDFDYMVMDKVKVPEDLTPGDYVLSFRWDCEGTAQVWSGCSAIEISSKTGFFNGLWW